LEDHARKQASTPNWDPPECPIVVPPDQRRQQEQQDDVTDVFKLGLAILRCLTPGKGMTSTRNWDRLAGVLDGEGIALVRRALGANRADRPTAKELYAYFYEVVSAQVRAPQVRYARLVASVCARVMDVRVEAHSPHAEGLGLTVSNTGAQTVDLSRTPDGYVIKKPESGPVFIEVTNRFGTLRVDLGDISLYELPKFTPVNPRGLPRPEIPRLGAFTL